MADLSHDDVRHIAKLARLQLREDEVEKFAHEMSSILQYVDLLNELDTDGIAVTAQVTGLQSVLRPDEIRESEASTDGLLSCSPLPIVHGQIETMSAHG